MMFKKILPLVFAAAAAHAAPAEAVEPTYVGEPTKELARLTAYVGEPTKKLAQQAARCGGVLTLTGGRLADNRPIADPQSIFLNFAIETIGKTATDFWAGMQSKSYENASFGPRDRRLRADLEVCTNTILTDVGKNKVSQNLALCSAAADEARVRKMSIGGNHNTIMADLVSAAAIDLGDTEHAVAIMTKERLTLINLGPNATRAAIQRCQIIFNNSSYIFKFAINDLVSGTNRYLAAPLTGPEIK